MANECKSAVCIGAAYVVRLECSFHFSDYSIGGWRRRRFMHFIVIIIILAVFNGSDVHCSMWSLYSMFTPVLQRALRTN